MTSPLKTAQLILILTVAFAAKGCGKGADTAGSEEPTGMATGLAGTWRTDCQDEILEPDVGDHPYAKYEITFPAHRTTGTYSYTESRYDGSNSCSGIPTQHTSGGAFHIGTEHSCGTDTCVDLDFDPGTVDAEYLAGLQHQASPAPVKGPMDAFPSSGRAAWLMRSRFQGFSTAMVRPLAPQNEVPAATATRNTAVSRVRTTVDGTV